MTSPLGPSLPGPTAPPPRRWGMVILLAIPALLAVGGLSILR